jgi:cytochrome oxidase Cu insertion factor (SCO1/SenC/PrrC family)
MSVCKLWDYWPLLPRVGAHSGPFAKERGYLRVKGKDLAMDKRNLVRCAVVFCVGVLCCTPLGSAWAQHRSNANSASNTDGLTDHVPDVSVIDQDGRRVNFYSDLVEGKTVAINFTSTRSTTVGPILAAGFSRVQKELSSEDRQDIELITITVDPVGDTPEILRAYAEKFGRAQTGWTFVTGDRKEIDKLVQALGFDLRDPYNPPTTVLIGNDPAEYWTKANGLSSPATLVKAILEAADHE